MMQKYLDIGKDYLSKKMEIFTVNNKETDYVTDQIPLRLRQPLAVLRQQQIDIEDAHVYENYYKNYPNHHISNFLLGKYQMMVEAEAEPRKYTPPRGEDSQILHFDQKLQNKALLLRQAIQQYDQGFFKTEDPIVCLAVINFHHKRGTEVEYRYPQNKDVESLQNKIVHHAMPDSSHHKPEDYNFFNFETEYKGKKRMLFGVSYFKQIKLTQQMKKQNSQFTRSYLQKAVAIISVLPLFGYLKIKLSFTTKFFFVKFTSFTIIEQAYKEINKHLSEAWPNIPITDLNIGTDLRSILQLFNVSDFYQIWKAVLYHKKIVVFGHSSSSVSTFILSLLSLLPGQNTFGIFSRPIAKYMQSLRELALPLKIFSSQNFLSMSFHIQDFQLLNKFKKSAKGNFLIGTTNRLLKQSNDFGIQLLVNLENCTIERKNPRRPWEGLNNKQKYFISQLSQIAGKERGLTYERSQDSIRDHFHSFLKGVLLQLISSMKEFDKFTKQCASFAERVQKQQKTGSEPQFFPPLIPQKVKKITLPQLLLNKSFAYFRQFKNQSLPQIILGKQTPSLYINNYDYYLRLNSEDFIVYNWLDKKLSFGKGTNVKNYEGKQIRFKNMGDKDQEKIQETKSIYVGKVANGKYDCNGFYVDEIQRYEGEYYNGVKQGYGKLVVGDQKYIGDFSNNLYDGQGQLLVGTDVYVGSFKNGVKNGYGTMQGSFQFDGHWQDGKPTLSMKEIKAKQLLQKNYKNVEEGQEELPVQVSAKKSQLSVKLGKKVEKIIRQIQSQQQNIQLGNEEETNQNNSLKQAEKKSQEKWSEKSQGKWQEIQEKVEVCNSNKQNRQNLEEKKSQQKLQEVKKEQQLTEKQDKIEKTKIQQIQTEQKIIQPKIESNNEKKQAEIEKNDAEAEVKVEAEVEAEGEVKKQDKNENQ